MKRIISLLFIFAITGMYCLPAFGWGQEGHRIIAKVAYDNLNKRDLLGKLAGRNQERYHLCAEHQGRLALSGFERRDE